MAAVAAELRRSGFRVTGSDSGIYPPVSTFLEGQGISICDGFDPANIPWDSLIVVGNAISRGNVELEAAMDRRLPLISLPDLISRRYLTGRRPLVIAGTHGKTTTTAMTAHILRMAGRDPGWMVGGMPLDLEYPCWMGEGEEFIIEGDEYDCAWFDKRPKFYHYQPNIAVITAVEFDHADIYPDIEAVEAVFRRFAGLLPRSGRLIINGDDPRALAVAEAAPCPVETFGEGENCNWRLADLTESGAETVRGEFVTPDGERGVIELGMIGCYNLRNALAALAASAVVGVEPDEALAALPSFRGIARRLQLAEDTGGIAVWDDFAHHPTAIAGTLNALRRRYPDRRLWALFEPRSNTLVRRYFTAELTEVFAIADRVVIGPIHRREMIPENERLDTRTVAEELERRGLTAVAVDSFDDVVQAVVGELRVGDVVVVMSNGGFGGVKERVVEMARQMDVNKLKIKN